MGDIPLRQIKNQVVYVHQPHLTSPKVDINSSKSFKYIILRLIFKINLKYAAKIIVQTHSMKVKLIASYEDIEDKVSVISAPPPTWFGNFNRSPKLFKKNKLKLFYPAAAYPHKNHKLLSKITGDNSYGWPIQDLILTVADSNNPNSKVSWIKCVGLLNASQCLRAYEEVDALLFLSTTESYGLPLVEAMIAGLPIICPDLEYSRILCGEEAIYFNPENIQSLKSAINDLNERLSLDWRPNWIHALENIPKNWGDVARQIFTLTKH
jgi:glycosyltransferase involved in cell wall biosynthesis